MKLLVVNDKTEKNPSKESPLDQLNNFSAWTSLNDSIMGGESSGYCLANSDGLFFEGLLIEEGGGFVSCRSPVFSPPLKLDKYRGLKLELDGYGRTLKFAVSCRGDLFGVGEFIGGGLHWAAELPTEKEGTTFAEIPFVQLQPTVRAKTVRLPVRFKPSRVTQLQLLHSKFGLAGKENEGFRPGQIRILVRSIKPFN